MNRHIPYLAIWRSPAHLKTSTNGAQIHSQLARRLVAFHLGCGRARRFRRADSANAQRAQSERQAGVAIARSRSWQSTGTAEGVAARTGGDESAASCSAHAQRWRCRPPWRLNRFWPGSQKFSDPLQGRPTRQVRGIHASQLGSETQQLRGVPALPCAGSFPALVHLRYEEARPVLRFKARYRSRRMNSLTAKRSYYRQSESGIRAWADFFFGPALHRRQHNPRHRAWSSCICSRTRHPQRLRCHGFSAAPTGLAHPALAHPAACLGKVLLARPRPGHHTMVFGRYAGQRPWRQAFQVNP